MYISLEQLKISLKELDPFHPFLGTSFLAFKLLEIEVDTLRHVNIADQEALLLDEYYDPRPTSKFYYIPLRGGGPKLRWVSKRKYTSSGLQKTRTTSFQRAFVHPNNSDEWAWRPDYLSQLSTVRNVKVPIPTFHLAIWMFRDKNWLDNTEPEDVIDFFLDSFHISGTERDVIFDTKLPASLFPIEVFQKEPMTWKSLRTLIGVPPDEDPDEGGALESLELIGVGPAKHIEIELVVSPFSY